MLEGRQPGYIFRPDFNAFGTQMIQCLLHINTVPKHNRVGAWCAKFQPERDLALLNDKGGIEDLRKRLDSIGVLDFRMLDDLSAAEWLKALDIWPADMPLSFELQDLGLSENDVEDDSVKAREASEERKREARLVSFNGKMLDPAEVDLLSLSDELQQSLSHKVLGNALGSSADLAEVERGERSSGRAGGKKGAQMKGRRPRPPEEKTELIGRLGEMSVCHWLQRILTKQDIDAAWVSENGALITGREGNDGLLHQHPARMLPQLKWNLNQPEIF